MGREVFVDAGWWQQGCQTRTSHFLCLAAETEGLPVMSNPPVPRGLRNSVTHLAPVTKRPPWSPQPRGGRFVQTKAPTSYAWGGGVLGSPESQPSRRR